MENKYYKVALWLAVFTILYNVIEGLVSIWFGFKDETLTLFGFGVDSFIEVMSGIGIVYPEKHGTKTCYKVNNDLVKEIVSILKRQK